MTIKKRRFRIFIVFLLLINLFNVKKLDAVIPYYVFPSKSNLKKQSISKLLENRMSRFTEMGVYSD